MKTRIVTLFFVISSFPALANGHEQKIKPTSEYCTIKSANKWRLYGRDEPVKIIMAASEETQEDSYARIFPITEEDRNNAPTCAAWRKRVEGYLVRGSD